jgi:RNA polymerase sigma-70 factor, ECF subfamily
VAPDPLDDPAMAHFIAHDYLRTVAAVALVVGDHGVAEDAVQEALLRAIGRRNRADSLRSPVAWITVVALNVARRGFRRLRTEQRALERIGAPAASIADTADALAVREALPDLPVRQREVVVLHYFCGWPVAEVARHLGVHEGTVKTSLARARAALAIALRDDEEVDDARPR